MADNVTGVSVNDDTLVVEGNGSAVPLVVSINDGVCSVSAMATNGKPIAAVKVIDKETGTEVPVNVFTCTEAVICNAGIPMQVHLQNLYDHTEDAEAHLAPGEKQNIETKAGAQEKATAAKNEAITASSLEIAAAKTAASEDATSKAVAARDAAYKYADGVNNKLTAHKEDNNNPHNVTAAQVGLGNVPNKATNDLQPTYTEADTLSNLISGERLAVAFGKIAKAIADFISHIGNKSNPHGVTASQAGALPKAGGTMTGAINMNSKKITGLPAPESDADAAPKGYVDTIATAMKQTVYVKDAGTDLNNYKTDGVYYFKTTVQPTNIPIGRNGWLIVITSDQGLCRQIWFRAGVADTSDHHMFTRTCNSNGWGSWLTIMTNKLLPDIHYGNDLPSSGALGQLFFKKV